MKLLLFFVVALFPLVLSMPTSERLRMRDKVKEMFYHGYRGYMRHAFPADELQPLSCQGMETWGSYSLTLLDALDTLVAVGDHEEFHTQVQWVLRNLDFHKDVNVSVFETNIRVLGGLLAAHMLYEENVVSPHAAQYNGTLLRLALDLGYRLLKAFNTPTGIPYGTVNLLNGVPPDEVMVTSTASGGTYLLEFNMLSRLTGDNSFERAARRATAALFARRSSLGLVGNHINISSGEWTHKDAGIGSGIDSFYEYMFKAYILYREPEYLHMFNESVKAIEQYLYKPPWYVEVHMYNGAVVWPLYNSLQGFWPGIQATAGQYAKAKETVRAFHGVWRRFGAVPEGFNLLHGKVQPGQHSYPLRPELAESIYYLYLVTHDPVFLYMGQDMVYGIERTRTSCGFATVHDVESTSDLEDRMESFFLSETCKYLYLLFDEGNRLNYGYVFNTEGHPFPVRSTYEALIPGDISKYVQPNPRRHIPIPPGPQPSRPWTKRDLQCPRFSYWEHKGVCEMECQQALHNTRRRQTS
eukprot:TRINITY_DN19456_c0_g1_i1.p1 TRINITY_DN19456_c0_g1~~TRINITY_DN19456_c0_g1_i1.p1  ORF type:complete len:525 (+),score=88.78 TRINITY_DN19456_c0_g1_i1:31-1605(+)